MNTIVEKIRAEVLRLIRETDGPGSQYGFGKMSACNRILNFLDTLQEQPVKIDIRKELASIEFMGVNDARDTETIARHFYELGRQSKEQPLCEDFDLESDRFLRKLPLRANTPPIPDEYIDEETFDRIARHFAQWGAEHRGSSEVPTDLEEAAKEYEHIEGHSYYPSIKDAFITGARWQKEQMMRSVVEGTYATDHFSYPCIYVPQQDLKLETPVRVIIVKED